MPLVLRMGRLTNATVFMALLFRVWRGRYSKPNKGPARFPLHFYTYEATAFARPVKETLCELEIPHIAHYLPRGSPKR